MLNDEVKKIGSLYGTVMKFSATVDPPSVGADSVVVAGVTVTGVKVGDIVMGLNLADGSTLGGVGIAGVFVSAPDTINILFINPTAGAIDPTSTTYTFIIFRPESNM